MFHCLCFEKFVIIPTKCHFNNIYFQYKRSYAVSSVSTENLSEKAQKLKKKILAYLGLA